MLLVSSLGIICVVIFYKPPNSKLRRGDRFTNSFNFLSPGSDKKKKTKKSVRQVCLHYVII